MKPKTAKQVCKELENTLLNSVIALIYERGGSLEFDDFRNTSGAFSNGVSYETLSAPTVVKRLGQLGFKIKKYKKTIQVRNHNPQYGYKTVEVKIPERRFLGILLERARTATKEVQTMPEQYVDQEVNAILVSACCGKKG